MSNNSKVYKVVRVTSTGRVSAMLHPASAYLVFYKKGITAEPRIGKLLAFDTLEHARSFLDDWKERNLEIWEATGENASKPTPLPYIGDSLTRQAIESFWEKLPQRIKRVYKNTPPYCQTTPIGTLACDSIRLDRLVRPE